VVAYFCPLVNLLTSSLLLPGLPGPMMPLKSARELCLEVPLYEEMKVMPADLAAFAELLTTEPEFDAWCNGCNSESTFEATDSAVSRLASPEDAFRTRFFDWTMRCRRRDYHRLHYWFFFHKSTLQKIGQHPSLADIVTDTLKPYQKELGKEAGSELFKGIGLASHGVGIGSYVYLRRVFEGLIRRHREDALQNGASANDGFDGLRMDEKIEALKATLPSLIVKNRGLYGILSQGIHELSEQECLRYFPAIKAAILMMLDQEIAKRKREETEAKVAAELARIASELGQKGDPSAETE
jgi:hypothetical protein